MGVKCCNLIWFLYDIATSCVVFLFILDLGLQYAAMPRWEGVEGVLKRKQTRDACYTRRPLWRMRVRFFDSYGVVCQIAFWFVCYFTMKVFQQSNLHIALYT